MFRRLLSGVLAVCFLSLSLSGCAHYHPGSTSQLAFSTLFIEPVANRASVPQAQALVSTQLRDNFEKDNRITLVNSADAADAVLNVTITGYDREVASVSSDDTGLARQFAIHLRAECTLVNRRDGKTLFEKRLVVATKYAYTDSGLPQSEYQTIPLLAQDLALKIRHTVLDVW